MQFIYLDPELQALATQHGDDFVAAWRAKYDELQDAYSSVIQQPVAYMGTHFQADIDSQDVIVKVLTTLVAVGAPQAPDWIDINNVANPMTTAQLGGLAATILSGGSAAFTHLQVRKAQLRAAQSFSDIAQVVW